MSKIVLIDDKWDLNAPLLQYALKAAKGSDTEIVGIYPVGGADGEAVNRAQAKLETVKQDFVSEGISFTSYVSGPDPQAFMDRLEGLMPVSLVLIGDSALSDEMIKSGAGVEAIKAKLKCPVSTASAITASQDAKKEAKGINWGRFILYAIGSIIMYGVFFPYIEVLNEKLFMSGTVLGGLAIMVAVVIHAWIWGNTTQILPKLFKLEK